MRRVWICLVEVLDDVIGIGDLCACRRVMDGRDGVTGRSVWESLAWRDVQLLQSPLYISVLNPFGLVFDALDVKRESSGQGSGIVTRPSR